MHQAQSQREIARYLLVARRVPRLAELKDDGVTAATLCHMEKDAEVIRLARGLYRFPDMELDIIHSVAEAAKRFPEGVPSLISALAFRGLTDHFPEKVWMAISRNDWTQKPSKTPVHVQRFSGDLVAGSVETQVIEGVLVKALGVAKTIADCFRHRRKIGLPVVVEGLQEARRQRKSTLAKIAKAADAGGIGTVIRPNLEVLTTNG